MLSQVRQGKSKHQSYNTNMSLSMLSQVRQGHHSYNTNMPLSIMSQVPQGKSKQRYKYVVLDMLKHVELQICR